MGRILIDLIDDVELILVNIFQTGFKSVTEEMLLEIQLLIKKCNTVSLSYIAKELESLYQFLLDSKYKENFDYNKITKQIATLSQSVLIIKNKINYDLTGGY